MKFDIVRVLEHYGVRVPHKTYGYSKVCCPVHDETRPSCSVRDNRMNCFGCGYKGDALDLIQEKEGIGYADAVRKAEEITGTCSAEVSEQLDTGGWFPGRAANKFGNGRDVSSRRGI